MSARCHDCGDHVTSATYAYPGDKQIASLCTCCDAYLCAECTVRAKAEDGMCPGCAKVVNAP